MIKRMSLISYFTLLMAMLAKQGSSAMSFNFPSFNKTTVGIKCEHDASLSRDSLALTRTEDNTSHAYNYGRASYDSPVQLWDPLTLNLTDFSTQFSFSIRTLSNKTDSGDGITFFLAPFDSIIANNSGGENLGLFSTGSGDNKFVAVEFDTFQNTDIQDFSPQHVGIDINGVVSTKSVSWTNGSMKDGRVANAWVRYNSTSQNLTVFLTYDQNPVFSEQYFVLSYQLNLSLYLPERVRVGFTASTGLYSQMHTLYSWSFNSTLDLIDGNKTSAAPNVNEGNGMSGLDIGLIAGFGGLLICGLGASCFFFWRKKRGTEIDEEEEEYDVSIDGEFERGAGPKRFSYNELRRATEDFAEKWMLGQGGFGRVYKGFLPESNTVVAVKRISKGSSQGKKEYVSEVTIISRLRHKNLVQLIGWCHRKGDFLLVYEFMPNKSLDKHLFEMQNILTWTNRYKIAHGLASSLLYLHEEWEQCVVHRDIKSSNVMLDSNFNAKLGDFGLARFADHESDLKTTMVAGTMGYMAPECVMSGKASKESDVYSFGVVALEICCGRRAVKQNEEPEKVNLVMWVWDMHDKGQVLEASDTRLSMEFDEQDMKRLMIIGLSCCHPDPCSRPSIKQVVSVMNLEAPLPNIPSKYPRLTYFSPRLDIDSSFYTRSPASGNCLADSSKSESQSIPLQKFSQTEM